jgi:hypothetical protein
MYFKVNQLILQNYVTLLLYVLLRSQVRNCDEVVLAETLYEQKLGTEAQIRDKHKPETNAQPARVFFLS